MIKSTLAVLALATTMIATSPTPLHAVGYARTIEATLAGKPLRLSDVGRYHCHDFEAPKIRCYTSANALERAVRRQVGGRVGRRGGKTLSAVNYVRLFENESYGGASIYLSSAYSNLTSIGWNDRVTSFKVVNGSAAKAAGGARHHHLAHGVRLHSLPLTL